MIVYGNVSEKSIGSIGLLANFSIMDTYSKLQDLEHS